MNPRYQKDAKVGKTRRSASSAKPKRMAGEQVTAKKSTAKGKSPWKLPSSPEIKKWRRIWYAMFALALLSASTIFIPGVKGSKLASVPLLVELVFLAAAIYIDVVIIRKLRNELIAEQKKAEKPKS